jgi:hypothetical protein
VIPKSAHGKSDYLGPADTPAAGIAASLQGPSDDERVGLNVGTVLNSLRDAWKGLVVPSSTRKICARTEAADSTLLTPFLAP